MARLYEHLFHLARINLRIPLALLRRTAQPLMLLVFVFVAGSFGYFILGRITSRHWGLLDCAFQTSITLTTVGYGDHLGATTFAAGQLYTMLLIVTGMGATLYSVSALTAFLVEGYIGTLFREVRLERSIEALQKHSIICGGGATGVHVIREHVEMHRAFVLIEHDEEQIRHLQAEFPDLVYIVGDATDEETLELAGISRASALVAALHEDKENLFLVVTGRFLNSDINIVAKCIEQTSIAKFEAAGATHVVSPALIGGLRIASQVLRPRVVDFLDTMLRASGDARVSDCVIEKGSALDSKTIADARIAEQVGLLIVAARSPDSDEFVYSPSGNYTLEPGTTVVVIGPNASFEKLRALAHA